MLDLCQETFVSWNITTNGDKVETGDEATHRNDKDKAKNYESCGNCPDYVTPEKIQFNDYYYC